MHRRLFRKAVQQGRSERRGESYSVPYVEPLSDVRTPLVAFVNGLLGWNVAVAVVGSPGLVRDLYGITISHR
jgi:hypothetical protein